MKNQKKAYIYALLAVLLWSSIASAFSLALRELDVIQLLLDASLVSIICLFIILLFQKKLSFISKLSRKDYVHSALLGFLNPFLYYLILLNAYALLPTQEAMALNYIWPISLAILSIPLLKQKISLKGFIAIVISFAGVFTIATRGELFSFSFTNLYGDILAFSSSIIWALFWILNVKDKRDEVQKLFLNFVFAFIYILIVALIFSEIKIPHLKGIMALSYIGLFEMGITFVFWLKALKYSESTHKLSQLIFLSPFISLIFINIIVKEPILHSTFVGLLLIIAGILLQQNRTFLKLKK